MQRAATVILWVVAGFYLYGATVHVLNMLGFGGFDWLGAPLKWQVLDISYLILDLAVAFGLARRKKVGIVAFYLAALSQILLYTVLREWIVDVPAEFAVSGEERQYLTGLVVFHVVTLVLVSAALWQRSREGRAAA